MSNKAAIKEAIRLCGGPTTLGRELGITASAVCQWPPRGRIPPHRVARVAALSGMPREKLAPGLFGKGEP